jgi:hypothetical protein
MRTEAMEYEPTKLKGVPILACCICRPQFGKVKHMLRLRSAATYTSTDVRGTRWSARQQRSVANSGAYSTCFGLFTSRLNTIECWCIVDGIGQKFEVVGEGACVWLAVMGVDEEWAVGVCRGSGIVF